MPVDDDGQPPIEEDEPVGMVREPSDDDFAPYDPSSVAATSQGPPSSEDAPASNQEPHPAAAVQFDERYKVPFEGLLFLGALSNTFNWVGHEFVIRTLLTGEVLEVAMLSEPYRGSMADTKAYQSAVCAGCVVSVDGQPVAIPITNEVGDTPLANKFNYILRHWFPPTLDVIYTRYVELEMKAVEVLEAMGKASG